jgi:hypothetical protein
VTEIASKLSNPCARSEDLIVEELGEELLVYDMKADRGHCLSPIAARVWRRCDGRTPAKDMSAELELDPDAVGRALNELTACKLLQPTPELSVVAVSGDGATRRELATRFVKAGAVAAAAPLIVSVAAPTPAQAQTLAFCAQFTPQGCGPCAGQGCCCCVELGGDGFLCVPPDNIGFDACCATFDNAALALGCGALPNICPPGAETESTELETQPQDAVTEPPPTEPAPTEPVPTEPSPTPDAPAPETPAPTTEAPATGGTTTPPTSEGASNP